MDGKKKCVFSGSRFQRACCLCAAARLARGGWQHKLASSALPSVQEILSTVSHLIKTHGDKCRGVREVEREIDVAAV